MSAQGESLMEVTRRCFANASRVNPDSTHRRVLRELLRWHELEVAEALLVLDRIAQLDPTLGVTDITALVRDARSALQPLWERKLT